MYAKQKINALSVVEATLSKCKKVKRPVSKFIIHIVELWLGMNCRYRFTNMECWGSMTEKSYRNRFKKFFDWFSFNFELVKQHSAKKSSPCSTLRILNKKSGKQTFRQKALKGLEICCLAFVDVAAGTALHGLATQTPCAKALKQKGQTLINHYVFVIKKQISQILSVTRYLAVDGYFMKK